VAPLRLAEGAVLVDSSDLTVAMVVARIVDDLRCKGLVG
jgi:cytidylate kinase